MAASRTGVVGVPSDVDVTCVLSFTSAFPTQPRWVQVVLAADCSAVTSRMYVMYVRHVCVTTHAPYRGDVTYVTTHALNRGDRACALRHVFF